MITVSYYPLIVVMSCCNENAVYSGKNLWMWRKTVEEEGKIRRITY
jgi:hypothetical protein